jgi:outer membrane protein OmpA-like peptidoglycan-associated protein
MDYPEGRTENQRVDIVLINAPLVEYVSKQTFAELVGTLAVHLTGSALSGDSILLEATGAEPKLRGDTGTARVPIRLRLAPAAEHVVLSAHGAIPQTGIQASDSVTVVLSTLSRRRVELSTARFEAVLRFDYNSSQLSAENRELLRQLIERIPDGATIEIGGSADVLGDIARNRRLAEERARATESYLRTLAASKRILFVARGIERRFSDTLPEGRFLNRSIRVTLP